MILYYRDQCYQDAVRRGPASDGTWTGRALIPETLLTEWWNYTGTNPGLYWIAIQYGEDGAPLRHAVYQYAAPDPPLERWTLGDFKPRQENLILDGHLV